MRITPIPAILPVDPRVRLVTSGTPGHRGDLVVYWPQTARRARSNAALSYAIAEANARGLPLLVYEALRVDYPFASDRFHSFVLQASRGEARRYRERGASYAFFLPRSAEEARGKLRALTRRAALLVTDDFPTFIVPKHIERAAAQSECPLVAFDDHTVVPLALFPKEEYAARTIRPKVHRLLGEWLRPIEENACARTAKAIDLPFDPFDVEREDLAAVIATLPLDHDVRAVAETPGGSAAAEARLAQFIRDGLPRYGDRNHPDSAATSGLSPYLHFGMIAAREVALRASESSAPDEARDGLLEQLLVRRTLAFNLAHRNPAHRTLDAAPEWARKTLREHESDPRPHLYTRAQLERAETGDELWNAAQRELVATGQVHNYVRMLWGKCLILWKKTAAEAFDDLVYLNDKYAIDGRDPNTYASILWCFGKHDRPWPSRPAFGTVRSMSTASARKKLELEGYLARFRR